MLSSLYASTSVCVQIGCLCMLGCMQALAAVREALDPVVHVAAMQHLEKLDAGGKLVHRLSALAGIAVAAGYPGPSCSPSHPHMDKHLLTWLTPSHVLLHAGRGDTCKSWSVATCAVSVCVGSERFGRLVN